MLGRRPLRYAAGALLVVIISAALYWFTQNPAVGGATAYAPEFKPDNFVAKVTNKYFALAPGRKFSYVKKVANGMERTEIIVLNETKTVMGVTTVVVWAREWLNDKLKEDTKDWYAQDKDGNVWYFGEAVANYKDGKVDNHAGSWEAGIDGARPGIIHAGKSKGRPHLPAGVCEG